MNSPTLKLTQLVKTFDTFTAVNRIDIEVKPGEIFGFLGPNGAGKTTTIKMIAGLLQPTEGELSVCGRTMRENPTYCRESTGYIPDRPYLYEKLTGAEYLSFIASLYRQAVNETDFLSRSQEYLHYFDLHGWQDNLIESYSHGMRQKLIMTSIFMLNQPLIVVDEPMIGLDPKSARIVKELFKVKASEGKAVFLSTHSMEIAEELCDRITIISHGSIVASGTVSELKQQQQCSDTLEDLFLQLTGTFELQEVIAALRNNQPAPVSSRT